MYEQKRVVYMKIMVYERAGGKVGIRNAVGVISTVACANHVASLIAKEKNAVEFTHPYGCDQLGEDLTLSFETLARIGSHPNIGGVVVVGLGCEEIDAFALAGRIKESQKPVFALRIQDEGGTLKAAKKGRELVRRINEELNTQKRREADLSELIVGLECGGSDYTSGIASNPALGEACDMLVNAGARAVFGETTELMGTEHILRKKCADEKTADFIDARVAAIEKVATDLKVDLRGTQPSPGNIEGGLTTIEEKSLGGVCKIGSTPIRDGIPFGRPITARGVTFMDTPGNDLACTLGLMSGGAHLVVFTTGRGTPMGFAGLPVIKVTANELMAEKMADNTDIDLSPILRDEMTIKEGGALILKCIAATASGKKTKSEKLGHREFSLYRISPILT